MPPFKIAGGMMGGRSGGFRYGLGGPPTGPGGGGCPIKNQNCGKFCELMGKPWGRKTGRGQTEKGWGAMAMLTLIVAAKRGGQKVWHSQRENGRTVYDR